MKTFRKSTMFRWVQLIFDGVTHSHFRSFILIFLLSFIIRLTQLNQISSRYLIPTNQWELGSIAISLMETGEFANPYLIPTGPTAHLPPIYPYIFSWIYQWLGLTTSAGRATWLLIIGIGSGLNGILPWFAEKFGLNRKAGLVGGIIGAFMFEWASHGEYLTGLLMGLILVKFLSRWNNQVFSIPTSLLFGLGIGIAFHLQPALLPVILGGVIFELWWITNPQKWLHLSALSIGIILACTPWGWRNYATFGEIFFIRSNFSLELRVGNHDGAQPTMELMDKTREPIHPRTHFEAAHQLKEMGEIEYMHRARNEATQWIKSNPREFFRLTIQRIAHLWLGPLDRPQTAVGVAALTLLAIIGLWHAFQSLSTPQRAAILIPLSSYPLVYYVVAYMPRYRIPIDWMIYILAGSAIWGLLPGNKRTALLSG